MRKRNVQILFRLTEEEAEHLNELVRKSGRTKEAFLRVPSTKRKGNGSSTFMSSILPGLPLKG